MTTYLFRNIPKQTHAALKRLAKRQRTTIRQVLLTSIENEIQRASKSPA